MTWMVARRALVALVGTALGCTSGAPLPPATPPPPRPSERVVERSEPEPAPTPHAEPVELVSEGSAPRRVLRYAPLLGTEATVTSELVMFQPVVRYATTYGPVALKDGVLAFDARVELDPANTMLGMFGMFKKGVAGCNATVVLGPRGQLTRSTTDERCARFERAFLGLRQTPLLPGVPLPEPAVGVGARWQVEPSLDEPKGHYVLIDVEDGVATLWGELDGSDPGAPKLQGSARPSGSVWLLARIAPGEIMTAATLAWVPAANSADTTVGVGTLTASSGKVLVRLNSVASSHAAPREQMRAALERGLAQREVAAREAAVRAAGITNDWRLIERLFEVQNQLPELRPAVAHALALLTGRSERSIEDFIEASAPHACAGDAKNAEALLSTGITLGGPPEASAHLLIVRAELRRARGELKAAEQDYTTALRLAPDDADVMRVVAWWRLSAPNARDRDPRQALALARSATNAGALLLSEQAQAAAHAELGQFKHALEIQERIVSQLAPRPLGDVTQDASSARRRDAARARLNAYRATKRWPDGLIRDELTTCYRYFGLSHTLL